MYRDRPVQSPSSSEHNGFGLKKAVTLLQSVTSSGYVVIDLRVDELIRPPPFL